MKNSIIFLILFISACSKVEKYQIKYLQPTLIKKISTEDFIPNSYLFSSVPIKYNNYWYYLDKSNGSIIKLNSDFTFNTSVQVVGDSSMKIMKAYSISLVNDYLFVIGNSQLLLYDLKSDQVSHVFQHNFSLSQQIHYYSGNYITSYIDEKNKSLFISSFQFDEQKIFNIKKLAEVEFEEKTNLTEKSGWLITTSTNNLAFIKDWVGEAIVYNQNFSVLKKVKLPFSGYENQNKRMDVEGFSSYYFEAFSVSKYQDNVAVMRELDFEDVKEFNLEEDIEDTYVRSRIHVFDGNLNLKKSIKLPYFSTHIFFTNDTLVTLNYEDENIFIYTIDDNP